jgi:chromosome segregation ATPase
VVGVGVGIQGHRFLLNRAQASKKDLSDKKILDLTRDNTRFKRQIREKDDTIKTKEEAFKKLQDEMVKKGKEYGDIERKVAEEFRAKEEQLKRSQLPLDASQIVAAPGKQEVDAAAENSLREENRKLQKKVEEFESRDKEFSTREKELRDSNSKLQQNIIEKNTALNELQQKTIELQTKADEIKERNEQLQRDLQEKTQQLQRHESELSQQQETTSQVTNAEREWKEKHQLLQQQLEAKTEELRQSSIELSKQREQVQTSLKTETGIREEIQKLQQTISEKTSELEKQREEFNTQKQQTVQESQSQMATLREAHDKKIEILNQGIKEKEANIEKLKQEFTTEQAKATEEYEQQKKEVLEEQKKALTQQFKTRSKTLKQQTQEKITALEQQNQELVKKLEAGEHALTTLSLSAPLKSSVLLQRIAKVDPLDMLNSNNGENDVLVFLLRKEKGGELKLERPLKSSSGSTVNANWNVSVDKSLLVPIARREFILVDMLDANQFVCYCLNADSKIGLKVAFGIQMSKFGVIENSTLDEQGYMEIKHCYDAAKKKYEASIIK